MADVGIDAEAALNALANRASGLLAELAIKDTLIAQMQARLAELEASGDAVVQP